MTPSVPDRWLEVHVPTRGELDRALAADALVERGARGVQETDDGLVTYFPPPDEAERYVESLGRALAAVGVATSGDIRWRWQRQEEWETWWRRGLAPRRVGRRLVVRPSWTSWEAAPDDLVLVLDPGVAFGTAEHGTTRGVLRLIEGRSLEGQRTADVGTGSGILAVAMVLLGAAHVDAFDVDPYACAAAVENARLNGVASSISVREGPLSARAAEYAGLVVNIEWVKLQDLVEALVPSVVRGGWLILGGILEAQRDEAISVATGLGLRLDAEELDEEWWAGAFLRKAD